MTTFRRKQIGRSSLILYNLLIIKAAILLSSNPACALFSVALLACAGIIFSSLTIEVNPTELRWGFAGNLFSCRLPRNAIVTIEEIRTPLWRGWGIRRMRGGWAYSVSGRKAVALTLNTGRRIILGTDRPGELAAALARV